MSYAHIRLAVDGPVGTLTLARPESRNAMIAEMGREVADAVEALNARADVRVVVVRGEGRSFSSGGDFSLLEERSGGAPEENRRAMRAFYELYLSIRRLHVPSVAALHGHAIGAGMCFAMGCDLRVAARGAKLGLTFVKVGLHPGMGATWLLPRLVGAAKAAELLLTGRVIDADEALRIGLLNEVHEPDALDAAVDRMAADVAAAAPVAVAQCKATLRMALPSLELTLDREAVCQAIDYGTADMREAIAAFRQKRAPRFEGR